MAIRLIAVDIDGTLLDNQGQIPAVNRAAIREALEANIDIVLVTGRAFHHAQPVAEALSERLVMILNNGALVKHATGKTIEQTLLDRELAREIIRTTRSEREGAALIFDRSDKQQYVFEGIDWNNPNRRHYYELHQQSMTEVEVLEEFVTEPPIQVTFNGSVADMRHLDAHLRALPIASRITITRTEYEARNFTLLDITAQGCSKGSALSFWTSTCGVHRNEVMAVGDNLNDREMLEFAGQPIVMGNAVPELKRYGWLMTGENDEGGLAEAIRSIALRSSPRQR